MQHGSRVERAEQEYPVVWTVILREPLVGEDDGVDEVPVKQFSTKTKMYWR